MIMRYEVRAAMCLPSCDSPEAASTMHASPRGRRPLDKPDRRYRAGTEAVAAYLNPLHSLLSVKIEDSHSGTPAGAHLRVIRLPLLLNTAVPSVFVTLTTAAAVAQEALEQRRLTVEDAGLTAAQYYHGAC